jgi:hypothetical protein
MVTAWDFPIESTYGGMSSDCDFHPVLAAEQILTTALDTGLTTDDDGLTTAPAR